MADEIRKAMGKMHCSRCQRKPRDMRDFRLWSQGYISGHVAETICPDCQSPEEAEEAFRNDATTGSWGEGLDARILDADELCAYIEAIPDDNEHVVPSDWFADKALRFVGFIVFARDDRPTLVTIWFPTELEPDEDGIRDPDGNVIPKLEMVNSDDRLLVADETFAFMEVPMVAWMGWDRLVVPVEYGQGERLTKTFMRFFSSTLDAMRKDDS